MSTVPPSPEVRTAVWRDLARQRAAIRHRRVRQALTFIAALLTIGALAGYLLSLAVRGLG